MQSLQPNSTLQGGKYKIISVLGQGGFGITYLANQSELERNVCIKEFFMKELCERNASTSDVTVGTTGSQDTVIRFKNKFKKEARTISDLDHPNIVKIHDIFEENNTAYYVMDYVEGENLANIVRRQGALSEATALHYIKEVAGALKYIHSKRINHLDIKPANIMLRKYDGKVVLIDFGLSKQYDDMGSQTSSTPVGVSQGYAPIEQYSPGGVSEFTPQTDIYSLGATLYWLIIGQTPPSANEILDEGIPSLPSFVSNNVREAITKAMQARKKDRVESVAKWMKIIEGKENNSKRETSQNNSQHKNVPNSPTEETKIIGEVKSTPKKTSQKKKEESESGYGCMSFFLSLIFAFLIYVIIIVLALVFQFKWFHEFARYCNEVIGINHIIISYTICFIFVTIIALIINSPGISRGKKNNYK